MDKKKMAQLVVHWQEMTFKGIPSETSMEDIKDNMFESILEINRIELELQDGGYLVMGEQAIKNAIFLAKEV